MLTVNPQIQRTSSQTHGGLPRAKNNSITRNHSNERLPSAPSDRPMMAAMRAATLLMAIPSSFAYMLPPGTLPHVLNVREFGAKGDGTTDDTAAIKAAIAKGKDM